MLFRAPGREPTDNGSGSKRSYCIHLFLQQQCFNEDVQALPLHDVLYCMVRDPNTMVGDTSLWEIVCSDALGPVTASNLQTGSGLIRIPSTQDIYVKMTK
jgi:hypothetical protein